MLRALLAAGLAAFAAPALADSPYDLSYAGRLTDAGGAPVAGPVDLQVKLFRSATGSDQIGVTLAPLPGVALKDGVFTVPLALSAADFHAAFNGTDPVWLEVTDATHGKTYPRQRFSAVPYALKVPVDNATVQYNASGELTVPGLAGKADAASVTASLATKADTTALTSGLAGKSDTTHSHTLAGEVTGDVGSTIVAKLITKPVDTVAPNTVGQVLKWDGMKWYAGNDATVGNGSITDGQNVGTGTAIYKDAVAPDLRFKTLAGTGPLSITTPGAGDTVTLNIAQASGVQDGYLAQGDFVTFNNKQAAITAASTVNAGTVTTALQSGLEMKPYGAAAGNTGEARFDELAANGVNYVALKAPDALAANVTFTLPAADATANYLLKTDGAGHLGFTPPTGNSDYRAAFSASAPLSYTSATGDFSLGTVGVGKGGTGLTATPANGQLAIGNGAGYALATLTAGTGITVTNGAGTITVASTTDPATLLPLGGGTLTGALLGATGTAAAPGIAFSGSAGTGLYAPAADTLAFSTAGSERLRVDSSGKVGVNTAAPDATLDVKGQVQIAQSAGTANPSSARLYIEHGNAEEGLSIKATSASPYAPLNVFSSTGANLFKVDETGRLGVRGNTFPHNASANIYAAAADVGLKVIGAAAQSANLLEVESSAAADLLVLDAAGKLGIGLTSPTFPLHVYTTNNNPAMFETDGSQNAVLNVKNPATTAGAAQRAVNFVDSSNGAVGQIAVYNTNPTVAGKGVMKLATTGVTRMVIDENGNVGIGSTAPASALHVSNANPLLTLTDTDTGADSIVSAASSAGALYIGADENAEVAGSVLGFRVDGDEKLRITEAGNVGLGTTTPGYNLQGAGERFLTLDGPTGAGIELVRNTSNNSYGNGEIDWVNTHNTAGNQGIAFIQGLTAGTTTNKGGALQFGTKGLGVSGFAQERMRITEAGNVGIGTVSPSELLHVRKDQTVGTYARIENANGAAGAYSGVLLYTDGGQNAGLWRNSVANTSYAGAGSLNLGTVAAQNVGVVTNNAVRMTVDPNGNVGIGTTSPAVPLDVNGALIRQVAVADLGSAVNTSVGANTWTNILSSFSYTKKAATTKLMIIVSGSQRYNLGTTGWGYFGMLINGTTYTMCGQYSTTNDSHQSPFCRVIISGLAAGAWTIQPQVNQTNAAQVCLGCAGSNLVATVEEIY